MAPSASSDVGTVDNSYVELRLLGGFSLQISGTPIALPMHSRRVLAYLSLMHTQSFSCDRGVLAERLWPDAATDRSRASLRTALWRLRRASQHLVHVEPDTVRLDHDVSVDVHRFRHIADRMMADENDDSIESARVVARSTELLPGWDESWLVLAREQLRQARLHALEASTAVLLRARRFPEAIDAMLAVIAEEPLRESAHAALIDAYLSEGNAYEAMRQFDTFATLLWHDLGIHPSDALCQRVRSEVISTQHSMGSSQVTLRTRSRVAAHKSWLPA